MRYLFLFLFLALTIVSSSAAASFARTSAGEPLMLHDWQTEFESQKGRKASCLIQTTGINKKQRLLLTMNLSVFIERAPGPNQTKDTTILKITAGRINKPDLSDITPIRIHDAWMTTSLGTSVGKITKIDRPEPYYLAGADGSDLFHRLLQGILKDGARVGFQEMKGRPEVVSIIPTPPASVIVEKLMPCLANVLPDVDLPI